MTRTIPVIKKPRTVKCPRCGGPTWRDRVTGDRECLRCGHVQE